MNLWGSSQMFSFISTGVLKFPSTILWQIWFLCHVNLYTVTNTVVPGVWNETQLLGLYRTGDSLVTFTAGQAMPLYWKTGGTFWCSINTCWLSSQLFIQQIPAIFHYEKSCLILLFMPTYTYSTFQHLLQYSVGQPYVTTVHPGGNILAKLLSM